ncbi:neutral/alkaline non-lysosomal ceramidase N-terminal domain-containing protein [Belliella kenyensis]|uniref:Neutral/alkaline non-lysosomal ceramidase N-terminal domain-containing protein n=1 Tax=Belliella kenyensis TaxID=1472724 RepID=A0ABV8EQ95_9BACT|nr:neutral/alkaline non-lysosomal ceramidase N-terminal domain-containing protein [Belliella kenyensis]MCH7401570.1 neutral/alkaline non-lysosomal ceramidase N-terminal domain-containing protein [Belliella kenyensis]MDN3603150.1 neutral/alkaline non-lysosomal ceramidase N-terminal domain-containing protein [Belliella kenyensis]
MNLIYKSFSGFFIGVFILLLIGVLVTSGVDRSAIQANDFYRDTLGRLADLSPSIDEGEAWLVGWSKVNATPNDGASLVGYKPRGQYEFVQDSSYIRALVIGNGESNVAILNYELMIIHPFLSKLIQDAIEEEKLPVKHIYFTATHTHSGIGGYIPGLMGEFAFGGFDQNIVDFLKNQSILSIKSALANQDKATISYQVSETSGLVTNRFVEDDPVDPFVRQLVFERIDGLRAIFFTYSAHATTLDRKFMGLSGDYPHYLMDDFESENYDFALYAAGTVGSHAPVHQGNTPEHTKTYANNIFQQIQSNIKISQPIRSKKLGFNKLKISLRDAQYRLDDNVRLNPYLFKLVFGEVEPHFDVFLIGNTLLISSSGEISGVFMSDWERYAREKGLNLIITAFNGSYIGYITPDRYYDRNYHEVRDMNWFGPGNGGYFDTLIRGLIDKPWH